MVIIELHKIWGVRMKARVEMDDIALAIHRSEVSKRNVLSLLHREVVVSMSTLCYLALLQTRDFRLSDKRQTT